MKKYFMKIGTCVLKIRLIWLEFMDPFKSLFGGWVNLSSVIKFRFIFYKLITFTYRYHFISIILFILSHITSLEAMVFHPVFVVLLSILIPWVIQNWVLVRRQAVVFDGPLLKLFFPFGDQFVFIWHRGFIDGIETSSWVLMTFFDDLLQFLLNNIN